MIVDFVALHGERVHMVVNRLIDIDRNYEDANVMPHMSAVPISIKPL